MSTAEIIAELPHLSSAELAQVEARLRELMDPLRIDLPNDSLQRPRVI
jgi:hypothetical protein